MSAQQKAPDEEEVSSPTQVWNEGRARGTKERAVEWFLFVCGTLSVLTTIGILFVLVFEAGMFFTKVNPLRLLTDTEWTPLFANKHFGIWPLLAGTCLTSLIAIGIAFPSGLLAAIYLSEFATERVRRWLKPMIEILAGVPTVVYGYFALIYVTPVLKTFIPGLSGFNALAPGIVMGLMIIPMISSLSEDALYAVPKELKEGAYGLGAGRLPTLFQVTLPAARSGIIAAVILATARAIGETMIVTIAAGQQPQLTLDPRVPIETMTAYIVQVSLGDTPSGSLAFQTIFVVGICLFLLTLCFNLLSYFLLKRLKR